MQKSSFIDFIKEKLGLKKYPVVKINYDYNAEEKEEKYNFMQEEKEEKELIEREAMDMWLRVDRIMREKIERAVTKEMITQEECNNLEAELEKESEKKSTDWWYEQKGQKSYDITCKLIKTEKNIEVLGRIKKA